MRRGIFQQQYYDIWTLRVKGIIEFDCWERVNQELKKGKSMVKLRKKFVDRFTIGVVPKDKGVCFLFENTFGGAAIYRLARA